MKKKGTVRKRPAWKPKSRPSIWGGPPQQYIGKKKGGSLQTMGKKREGFGGIKKDMEKKSQSHPSSRKK